MKNLRLSMLLMVAVILLAVIGCSPNTPSPNGQSVSVFQKPAATIIVTKSTLINVSKAVDAACKGGLMSPADCRNAAAIYVKAQKALDGAERALVVVIRTKNPSLSDYNEQMATVNECIADILEFIPKTLVKKPAEVK